MAAPRRAVVLSGGGAKGIFESGVVHALAQTGYEAEVITGSSVGALNAVGYAEVVRARREEGPERALDAADSLLGLWQHLDDLRVADLDAWGWRVWAFAAVSILFGFALVAASLSGGGASGWLVLLERAAGVVLGLAALVLGAAAAWLWMRLPGLLRRHVRRGLAGPSLTETENAGDASSGERVRHLLLRAAGLLPSLFGDRGLRRGLLRVVPDRRRLSEYRRAGLDVRLTRTNVRTGRTEVSEHLEPRDLDRPGMDRGLRVLGDPRVVEAALASSAFPSAFPPVGAERIYPEDENRSLYARVRDRALAKRELRRLFGPQSKEQYVWLMSLIERLAEEDRQITRTGSEALLLEKLRAQFYGSRAAWNRLPVRALFVLAETRGWPQLPVAEESVYADRYFDGGILDNTPLSTALAALREGDAESATNGAPAIAAPDGHEAAGHEVLVVLLSPLRRARYVRAREAARLEGPALGWRALRLQAERRVEDDVRVAEKIDRLLAEKGLLEEELRAHEASQPATSGMVGATVAARPAPAPGAETWAELFSKEQGSEETEGSEGIPALGVPEEKLVRVQVTRVHPTWDLPWLLALDDRLGFHRDDARVFQVRGCRDTLLALRARHEHQARTGRDVPAAARRALEMTGNGGSAPAPGWICPTERCSLRDACDRVAATERQAEAAAQGAAPRP